jgi:hypothetical protein
LKRINNQLKKYKKRGFWLEEKTHLKKKTRVSTEFCRIFAHSGLFVTQTSPATGSIRHAGLSLITMVLTIKFASS